MGRVWPLGVVILQPFPDTSLGFRAFLEGMQVNAFVLQRPPQTLDHAVVDPATFAVHADLDLRILQHINPVTAGELAALIGVEYLRRAVCCQRFLQRINAELGVHAV